MNTDSANPAIPSRRRPLLREILPRHQHDLHADAVRTDFRQADVRALAGLDFDSGVFAHLGSGYLRRHAEECG